MNFNIEFKGLDKIVEQLTKYASSINEKEQLLLNELGRYGVTKAQIKFAVAITLSDDNDGAVDVSWSIKDNTLIITAKGDQICFLEFGAGVYFNGSGKYPLPLPEGVVGIGQYGKGRGKRKSWGYYRNGDKNDLVITHGTPAVMPMYNTLCDICEYTLDKVKEIFNQ